MSQKQAVSRDGRLMDSSPGVTFLRPIGAAKIPRACRKPSRYITYSPRLMGLGDRIDVFFHAFSDVYSRLGRLARGLRSCGGECVIRGWRGLDRCGRLAVAEPSVGGRAEGDVEPPSAGLPLGVLTPH